MPVLQATEADAGIRLPGSVDSEPTFGRLHGKRTRSPPGLLYHHLIALLRVNDPSARFPAQRCRIMLGFGTMLLL